MKRAATNDNVHEEPIMAKYELGKAYDPKTYEAALFGRWEESGAFAPDPKATKGPFTIIMPPPNANGDLHLGHGMFVVEDILARFKRMQGHAVLWLPGTDHAGIETQVVFERELAKDGRSRFDLGHEEFYREALAFTLKNQPKIIGQLRDLGFSADWRRLKFTLDADIIRTVYATFKQLHDDGLIYRGNRIVNWCTTCRSSFADIEVKHVDREDAMYTLDYGTVQIATTRPETIFADAAVAVNPADERYARLIGQTATVPLTTRPVAIIGDEYVEPSVGTGALKVTPAHDVNDYEIGRRHDLPEISVVDLDGRLINVSEEFAGLSVVEGRRAVVAALEQAGKLVATTPLTHSVGIHDRCDTVIEPLITEQWYLRMAQLNEPVIWAFEADEIRVTPARFKKVALDWLRNEHDWNIGRQNWFGIRVPVFYKDSNDVDKDPYLVTDSEEEARAYYGEGKYRAETDVFDTWFSSGQWPYATLMATGDFDHGHYPTSVMMTARDILTKWVTRMAMFSLYCTKQIPFHDVYLWGMVNDAHGKKMSKSRGNVINPLEMTAKYGTDALRLALTIGITPGNDGSLSEAKIEGYRNFCNKLWNVARFILGQLPDGYSPAPPEMKAAADAWMMNKVETATAEVTTAIEEYRFSDAGQLLYSLLWDDFADWYVEASKTEPNHDLLVYALETILKLIHPIAPFVSEAIWSALAWQERRLITTAWPVVDRTRTDRQLPENFEQVKEVISAIRAICAEEGLREVTLLTPSSVLVEHADLIQRLARVRAVRRTDITPHDGLLLPTRAAGALQVGREVVAGRRKRLGQQVAEKEAYARSLELKLENPRFMASAPEEVRRQTREKRDETRQLLAKLDQQLRLLG